MLYATEHPSSCRLFPYLYLYPYPYPYNIYNIICVPIPMYTTRHTTYVRTRAGAQEGKAGAGTCTVIVGSNRISFATVCISVALHPWCWTRKPDSPMSMCIYSRVSCVYEHTSYATSEMGVGSSRRVGTEALLLLYDWPAQWTAAAF